MGNRSELGVGGCEDLLVMCSSISRMSHALRTQHSIQSHQGANKYGGLGRTKLKGVEVHLHGRALG